MSVIGKSTLSYKKLDTATDKPLSLGQKTLVFAHKFTSAGQTDIVLSNLTAPSELTALGFVNPNASSLIAASIYQLRDNLEVVSSIHGKLMDYLSYDVISNNLIRLKGGAVSQVNEIITCRITPVNFNGLSAIDGRALVQTGTLAVGASDFVVGDAFQVNKYSNTQLGDVLVFVDGVLQMRNVSNATASPTADGNYQEVLPSAGNLSNTIRFNKANPGPNAKNIVVMSNGLIVERPSSAVLARFDTLAGQMDAVIQDLAVVTGNPTSTYQTAPNSIDLSTFGNQVKAMQTETFYDFVVGSSTQVSQGKATHTSIQAAHDAASTGAKILILQGTYTENVTITKQVFLEGKGHGTVINGSLSLNSGSSFSMVKWLKVNTSISIVSGANNIFLRECWQATGQTITNAGSANSILVSQE